LEKKAAIEEEIRLMKMRLNTGANRKAIGEVAAIDAYRKEKSDDESVDVDAVVEDATTTSMS
jgi:hypothetical protein